MKYLRIGLSFALLFGLSVVSASSADASGKWTSTFDTQIGEQHYTYVFKVDDGKLTGTATSDRGETKIEEGTMKGDDVFFVENINYQGMAIRIEYRGKISGDEIKFTRKVGDFATEEIVAKRTK
jgi:hypothetical protein